MMCTTMQQAPELWALGSALLGGSRRVCPGSASSQAMGPHPQPLPAVLLKQTLEDTDPGRYGPSTTRSPEPTGCSLGTTFGLQSIPKVYL